MLKYKFYDKENRIEKCWYDSTNILYSECFDYENDYKDLNVVFKEGRTYLYKKIDVKDYLSFRNATSQGSALNKFITKKENGKLVYECLRLSDTDLSELEDKRKELLNENSEKKANGTSENEVLTFEIDSENKSLTVKNDKGEELYKTDNDNIEEIGKTVFGVLDLIKLNYNKRYK